MASAPNPYEPPAGESRPPGVRRRREIGKSLRELLTFTTLAGVVSGVLACVCVVGMGIHAWWISDPQSKLPATLFEGLLGGVFLIGVFTFCGFLAGLILAIPLFLQALIVERDRVE